MKLFKSKKKINGQGMTEYLIIVGMIGVGALAAFTYFGGTLRESTAGIAAAIVNDTTASGLANNAATLNATAANAINGQQSTLANFSAQQALDK